MTEFYNRYRSLFTAQNQSPPARYDFLSKKEIFLNRPKQYEDSFTEKQVHRKLPYVGRSPALDQFQRAVLPKLNKDLPTSPLYRLKMQMQEYNNKMSEVINHQSLPSYEFYQLPKLTPTLVQPLQKKRVYTEPNVTNLIQSRFEERKGSNIIKNIQELQKLYMKDRHMGYFKKRENGQQNTSVRRIQTVQENQEEFQKAAGSRFYQKKALPSQNVSAISHKQKGLQTQRWNIKILPESSKLASQKNRESRIMKANPEMRQYENNNKHLFGVRQNPYQFVNSKIQQIKRSQKYFPRGYINHYRDCIYRRRNSKNNIQERRNKLRKLLKQQNVGYC